MAAPIELGIVEVKSLRAASRMKHMMKRKSEYERSQALKGDDDTSVTMAKSRSRGHSQWRFRKTSVPSVISCKREDTFADLLSDLFELDVDSEEIPTPETMDCCEGSTDSDNWDTRCNQTLSTALAATTRRHNVEVWQALVLKQKAQNEFKHSSRERALLRRYPHEKYAIRLADIPIGDAGECKVVTNLMFRRVILHPEREQIYADVLMRLDWLTRDEPASFAPTFRQRPNAVKEVLLSSCEHFFNEMLPLSLEPSEEEMDFILNADELQRFAERRKKDKATTLNFMGRLFLRDMLSDEDIGHVVDNLIGNDDDLPEEHMIECACELLELIGQYMADSWKGQQNLRRFAARLGKLKGFSGSKKIGEHKKTAVG